MKIVKRDQSTPVKTGGGILKTVSTLKNRVVHTAKLLKDGRLFISFLGADGVSPDAGIIVSSTFDNVYDTVCYLQDGNSHGDEYKQLGLMSPEEAEQIKDFKRRGLIK